MKLVNNRYKIIDHINQDKLISVYKVEDLRNKNKVAQLIILHAKRVSNELIEYYIKDFIEFKNLNNKHIMQDYHFNRLTHVNNRKNNEIQYYFVSEYHDEYHNIAKHIQQFNFTQIIDLFVSVCRVLNYLHNKGLIYGDICIRNIFYNKKTNNFKLTSLANVRLKKQYRISLNESLLTDFSQTDFTEALNADLYDLGLLLLKFIKGTASILDPDKEIKQLEAQLHETSNNDTIKVLPIIKQLINQKETPVFSSPGEVIQKLNQALQTSYQITDNDLDRTLHFTTKLINQEPILTAVEKVVKQVASYEESKNVFLIKGTIGSGQTRLLKELEYKYSLQGLDTYSAYTIHASNENNRHFLINMFRKLMRDCDVDVYDKYEKDLKAFLPELSEQNGYSQNSVQIEMTRYQLLERIGNFIRDSISNRQVIFLIDNIHLANEFTLQVISRIIQLVKQEKAILILTYNDFETNNSVEFNKMIHSLRKEPGISHITMKKLNEKETGELIQGVLSASHIPKLVTEKIHRLSDGNPSIIMEVLKDLHRRNIIYTNPENGLWSFKIQNDDQESAVTIPTTLEQVFINQMKQLDETTYDCLQIMGIIRVPKTFDFWRAYFNVTENELNHIFNKLISLGVITVTVNRMVTLYGFKNKLFHNFLSDKLPITKKTSYHARAAKVIEDNLKYPLLDELIYHLEQANLTKQAKGYCLIYANELKRSLDWTSMFDQLKKALSYEDDIKQQININLQIADNYLARDETENAYIYYKNAEKLISHDEISKDLIHIYLSIATLEIYQINKVTVEAYFKKIEQALAKFSYPRGEVKFRLLEIIKLNQYGNVDETIKQSLAMLNELKNDTCNCQEMIANTKSLLAQAYIHAGIETEKSIQLFEEAIKVYKQEGLIREQIYSLNSLAAIYLERLHLYDVALEKFTELLEFSKEHNFPSGYILSLINIGSIYGSKGEIKKSYETFKNALDEIKYAKGVKNQLPFIYMNIIRMGLNMHMYKESGHYMNLFQKEFETSNFPEHEEVQMNLATSFVYYAQGVYDKSDEANNKVLASHLDETHPLKGYQTARKLMYQVRINTPEQYEKDIQEIFNLLKVFSNPHFGIILLLDFTLVLHEEGDFENVARMNVEIHKLFLQLTEPMDRILTRYHYLRGVVADGLEAEEQLLLSLKYAIDEIEFSTRIMVQLAERYLQKDQLFIAANYYLEAGFIFKKLLEQVPDEYKVSYVHAHQCALAFRRLKALEQTIIDGKPFIHEDALVLNQVNSPDEVKELMNTFNVAIFTKDDNFMATIKEEHKKLTPLKYNSLSDIIANLSSDTAKSIELLLSHLLVKTVANRAVVFTEAADGKFEILSAWNDEVSEVNIQMFNRIKTTLEPIILYSEAEVFDAVVNKVKRSMYLPIFGNNYYLHSEQSKNTISKNDMRYSIIGFLYVESDKIVNNLTIEAVNSEIGFLNLISSLIETRQLKVAASIDKVTGALTRKFLEDSISEHFNANMYRNETFSLLMYDLDRFKRVNDTYGHQVGDEVLRNLSELVMKYLGNDGILGRYGGEEFIVILPKKGLAKAMKIAEELRILISEAKLLPDDKNITVSLGVVSSDQGKTINELIQKADQSLYAAKESGRNKALAWDSQYTKMVQKKKQTRFTSGDEVQDSRNVLALVELLQLVNKNVSIENKISEYLSRVLEAVNAQSAYLLKVTDGIVSNEWDKNMYQEKEKQTLKYDKQLIKTTILTKEPNIIIQIGDDYETDFASNLPNWQSNLVVPVIYQDQLIGLIYLVAPARVKEFDENDIHVTTVFSNIAAFILNEV